MYIPSSFAVDGMLLYSRNADKFYRVGELRVTVIGGDTYTIDDNAGPGSFSPDGKYIIYARKNGSKYEVVKATYQGKGKQVVARDFGKFPQLCWRQAGTAVYNLEGANKAWEFDVSSGNSSTLFSSSSRSVLWTLSASADHSRLCYWNKGVWLVDVSSGSERKYDGCGNFLSPGGAYFTNNQSDHQTLKVRTWDGTVYKTFTAPGGHHWNDHRWSTNSADWIAYPVGESYQLGDWANVWVHNISTNTRRQVTDASGGSDFVHDFWVGTPPSSTPAVSIDFFSADPQQMVQGQSATLSWEVSNATSVSIDQSIGTVSAAGSKTVSPSQTLTYTLTAQGDGGPVEQSVSVTVTSLRAADNPVNVENGLDVAYFSLSSPDGLPDFSALSAVQTDVVTAIDYASSDGEFATSGMSDNVGVVFEGYIDVPQDGMYTFYVESDDGSALYIGQTQVVGNDGIHAMVEASGSIALAAGKHAFSLHYFEAQYGAGCIARYEGPGINKTVIPASAFYHVPTAEPSTITITQPVDGMTVTVGETLRIGWNAYNVEQVLIKVSFDGRTWDIITTGDGISTDDPAWGAFDWAVPDRSEKSFTIKISDYSNPNIYVVSGSVTIGAAQTTARIEEMPGIVSVIHARVDRHSLRIHFSAWPEPVDIALFDACGAMIMGCSDVCALGNDGIRFDFVKPIAAGVYFLQVRGSHSEKTLRLIISK